MGRIGDRKGVGTAVKDDKNEVKLLIAGEAGLVVEFEAVISPEINGLVQQLMKLLKHNPLEGIIEVVPTYKSITIYFNPLLTSRERITQLIRQLLSKIEPLATKCLTARMVHVPVCYGGVFGPDLEFVARYAGMSPHEVISLHTAEPYLVYMLGFTPGFPYLGGMSELIAVPRQEKPRTKVPAGSVGIGGNQTGVYPIESPGEWWLIGRTPLKTFQPASDDPFLISAGDYLQFYAISIEDYFAIRREVESGNYIPEVSQIN